MKETLREFQTLGSVGPATAGDLWQLGYRSIAELVDADPEDMYRRMDAIQGPEPELSKWWAWKDA
jgi:Pathogenicity locus